VRNLRENGEPTSGLEPLSPAPATSARQWLLSVAQACKSGSDKGFYCSQYCPLLEGIASRLGSNHSQGFQHSRLRRAKPPRSFARLMPILNTYSVSFDSIRCGLSTIYYHVLWFILDFTLYLAYD
jgi:hypothetical protein